MKPLVHLAIALVIAAAPTVAFCQQDDDGPTAGLADADQVKLYVVPPTVAFRTSTTEETIRSRSCVFEADRATGVAVPALLSALNQAQERTSRFESRLGGLGMAVVFSKDDKVLGEIYLKGLPETGVVQGYRAPAERFSAPAGLLKDLRAWTERPDVRLTDRGSYEVGECHTASPSSSPAALPASRARR